MLNKAGLFSWALFYEMPNPTFDTTVTNTFQYNLASIDTNVVSNSFSLS